MCEAKGLGMELSVFCQQNAASSIEQPERAAGSLFIAEVLENTAELAHKCAKVVSQVPSTGTRGLYCLLDYHQK